MIQEFNGKFGPYGGQFVPETLMPALEELTAAYLAARDDPHFHKELDRLLETFVGRPTPLTHARRLTEKLGGAQIYLKREDLANSLRINWDEVRDVVAAEDGMPVEIAVPGVAAPVENSAPVTLQ